MNLLYIDANIYLEFYKSNNPEYKKLLNSIVELKDKIFITEQFVFEIERNQLKIYKDSLKGYTEQSILERKQLPLHLDDLETKISDWNRQRTKLRKAVEDSNKDMDLILEEMFKQIAKSEDIISIKLKEVFDTKKPPTSDVLQKARYRKEIGNPPGKSKDTLGDQLSWEMLLEEIYKVSRIWFVTRDGDYFVKFEKEIHLHNLLYQEIKTRNPNIEIKVFNTLSDALQDFNKVEKVKALPSKDELKEISLKENMEGVIWSDYLGIMNWNEANAKAKELGMRLPTSEEFQKGIFLGIHRQWDEFIKGEKYENEYGFIQSDIEYWTSNEYRNSGNKDENFAAYSFAIDGRGIGVSPKIIPRHVRCIR